MLRFFCLPLFRRWRREEQRLCQNVLDPESIRITPLSEVAAQQRMDCDDDLFDAYRLVSKWRLS